MAITIDAVMDGGSSGDCIAADNANSATDSDAITLGAAATLLVVPMVLQSPVITGIAITNLTGTWNGVALSVGPVGGPVSAASGSDTTAAIYYLVNPANNGDYTLFIDWDNTADAYISAASFNGTDTSTGVDTADNTTATNTTSITVTSESGATVAVFGVDGSTPTMSGTTIFTQSDLDPGGGASYQIGDADTFAHTFTGAGGTVQALAGIHILEAAAGGAAAVYPMDTGWMPVLGLT